MKPLLAGLRPGRVDALLIAAGAAIRLRQYLAGFSLEVSEAQLSLNLIARGYADLLRPLDLDQAAPIGFLWIERAMIDLFGSGELALRAFPTFCGIASLFLFRALARRVVSPFATHVGLGLFAVSPFLVSHANHVKQYSSDVATTLLLLLLAHRAMTRGYDRVSVAALGAVGALALWLSHPAVFVLGGIGLVWTANLRAALAPVAVCGTLWAASFGALYGVSLRHFAHNDFLSSYWGNAFMPLPPRSIGDLGWFQEAFFGTFRDPGGFLAPGLAGALSLIGIVALARRSRTLVVLLVSSIVLALLASGLGRFPFAGRVILFLMPMLLIFLGAGIDHVRELTWRTTPAVTVVLLGVLAFDPVVTGILRFLRPRPECDARAVVAHVGERIQPGDGVYLYSDATSLFRYYAPRFGLEGVPLVIGTSAESNHRDAVADLDGLMGRPRVWLVFAHVHNRDGHPTEEEFFLFELGRRGRQLDAFRSVDASAYLYDLAAPPPTGAVGTRPDGAAAEPSA